MGFMGKLTALFVVLSVVCTVLAQETTTVVEKVEDTTPVPTRLPPQPSTTTPGLVHKVKEMLNDTLADAPGPTPGAEKNTQKNSSAAKVLGSTLVFVMLILCTPF